jgi:dUTP pyrophosphatase
MAKASKLKKAKKEKTSGGKVRVRFVRMAHAAGLPDPAYQSKEAAGVDLVAAVAVDAPVSLAPGARALIPTGLILELPKGFEAQVRPRSGLAAKHGVTVLNSPGTIDSDYRGEVKVILVNLGQEPFVIQRGERIAQMVIAPVVQAKLKAAKAVTKTERGDGGFGSTGIKIEKRSKK